MSSSKFLLTPLREGRLLFRFSIACFSFSISTHAPAGRGDPSQRRSPSQTRRHFYSRPCGRGDTRYIAFRREADRISTHAPAGGATYYTEADECIEEISLTPLWEGDPRGPSGYQSGRFLLTPLREGRRFCRRHPLQSFRFLLTPLREGRLCPRRRGLHILDISTHAPAGGATFIGLKPQPLRHEFLLTPLREGRRLRPERLDEGVAISTHAPAGGATAIFHKSVMRFCGKLPKDDTVLCLASFGFPRRDPKAVYLAWISCANLPQKCVREGLALKDQGTSCFHEGLASHAFDPVLV